MSKPTSKWTTIAITKETHQQLVELSKTTYIPINKLITLALQQLVERREKVKEIIDATEA